MTPGARIKAAIDLSLDIEAGTLPADVVMDSFFRGRRYVGARDRRSISETVYGLLRRRAGLDWWILRSGPESATALADAPMPRVRARVIADLILARQHPSSRMADLFSGNRHCPEPLTDSEWTLARVLDGQAFEHPEMPPWVALEYPAWLHDELAVQWGDDLPRQMTALNCPATLDLRVNGMRATRDAARAALAGEGQFAEATPLSPLGLRLTGRTRLGGLSAFRDGLIEVQDEAAQVVSLLVDARPGMTVVDFCAGAGGKTLAMAAQMGFKAGEPGRLDGRILACDTSGRRLKRIDQRLGRAGIFHGVDRRVLASEADPWIERNLGIAERVLVDAPCSGLGTWRRNPDQRWRLAPALLESTRARQRSILDRARLMVRPGGRLIYVTCSLLESENKGQVDWFLERHREFGVVSVDAVWGATVGGRCPTDTSHLTLTPADQKTDGFFCAILEKRM